MKLRTAMILSVMVTIIGLVAVLPGAQYLMPGDQAGYEPIQPIAFSHRIHAGDNQIPCLYCHSSASRSHVAGIPAASTCMNCHTQIRKDAPEVKKIVAALNANQPIRWVRIHQLPAHAVFDHSRHVNARVACQTCHGPVQTMDRVHQMENLTMGFCVDCHRRFGNGVAFDSASVAIATASQQYGPPEKLSASTDCSVCHH